jgi:hypothetical protein
MDRNSPSSPLIDADFPLVSFVRELDGLLQLHYLALLLFSTRIVPTLSPELAFRLGSTLCHSEHAAVRVRGAATSVQTWLLTALQHRLSSPTHLFKTLVSDLTPLPVLQRKGVVSRSVAAELTNTGTALSNKSSTPESAMYLQRFLLVAARSLLDITDWRTDKEAMVRGDLCPLALDALSRGGSTLTPTAHVFYAHLFKLPQQFWLQSLPRYLHLSLASFPRVTKAADLTPSLIAAVNGLKGSVTHPLLLFSCYHLSRSIWVDFIVREIGVRVEAPSRNADAWAREQLVLWRTLQELLLQCAPADMAVIKGAPYFRPLA